jgi:activator of HSP90 ATPase
MPLSKALFDQHEADQAPASSAATTKEQKKDNFNVRAWHWEELSISDYAYATLKTLLCAAEIKAPNSSSTLSITDVTELKGDAYLTMRKGKRRLGYDLNCKIAWAGTVQNDDDEKTTTTCKGTCVIPELVVGDEPDEVEIEDFTVEGDSSSCNATMKQAMKKAGADALRTQLELFIVAMNKKKDTQE